MKGGEERREGRKRNKKKLESGREIVRWRRTHLTSHTCGERRPFHNNTTACKIMKQMSVVAPSAAKLQK